MQQSKDTSEIDYEKEVKRVYPDASVYEVYGKWWEIRSNSIGRNSSAPISGDTDFQHQAWESAYNNLKKANKL